MPDLAAPLGVVVSHIHEHRQCTVQGSALQGPPLRQAAAAALLMSPCIRASLWTLTRALLPTVAYPLRSCCGLRQSAGLLCCERRHQLEQPDNEGLERLGCTGLARREVAGGAGVPGDGCGCQVALIVRACEAGIFKRHKGFVQHPQRPACTHPREKAHSRGGLASACATWPAPLVCEVAHNERQAAYGCKAAAMPAAAALTALGKLLGCVQMALTQLRGSTGRPVPQQRAGWP